MTALPDDAAPHTPPTQDAAPTSVETAREEGKDKKKKKKKDKKRDKDKDTMRDESAEQAPPMGEPRALAALTAQFDFTRPLPESIARAAFRSGGYEYDEKMDKDAYEDDLKRLQIEMQKAMAWIKEKGERVCIVFEGRDAAGKGGAIQRLVQHLSPRSVRVAALPKPTETERGQWYFQRYVSHMPTKGEIVAFDRSWYNRAGVEPVFGFSTAAETDKFLAEAPHFERMLARDGVRMVKFFLTIGREMQMTRLSERWNDPLARWKISPMDNGAVEKWDAYSQAYDRMLALTDHAAAPWTIIRANDKKRSRLAVIRQVLTVLPYAPHDEKPIGHEDPKIVLSASDYLAKGGER